MDEEEVQTPEATGPPLVLDGDKVAIRDPDGTVSMVYRGDLGAALTEGAVPASETEWQRAKLGAGGQVASAAIGLGQGFTGNYGLPLIVEGAKAVGATGFAEDVRRGAQIAKATHGDAMLGGEVVGSLAGAAFMPSGAARAVEGTGALARAGSRIAGAAPRLLAEGAAIGVGQQLTEDTLGNHEMVAQKYLAAGVEGGVLALILGGGLHAGGGAAADLARGAAGAVGKRFYGVSSLLNRTGEEAAGTVRRTGDEVAAQLRKVDGKSIEALAERKFGYAPEGLGEKVREAYVKGASGVSGKDRSVVDRLTKMDQEGREARRVAVFDSEKEIEAAQKEFREAGDRMLRANKLTMEEFQGELKAEKIAASVKAGNEAEVAAYARQQIAKIIETLEGELRHEMGVAPQSIKSLESIARTAYHADLDIAEALARGGETNPAVFMSLDRVKRDVQRWVQSGYNAASKFTDPFEARLFQRSVKALDTSQESLRRGLEDAGLFGKAADVQRAINADWTTQIDASKRFHQALTTEVGRDPSNPFRYMRGIDPAKADTYARGLLNPNADLTHKAVRDYVESTERLAKTLRENVTLPPEKLAEVQATIDSASRFRKAVEKAEKTLTLVNQYKHLTSNTGDGFATLAGMLGLSTGPLGAIVGAGLGTLANPGRAVAQLAALERMGAKVNETMGGAAKAFFAGAKSAAAGAAGGAGEVATRAGETGAQASRAVTAEMVRAIRAATTNPAALTARIADALSGRGLAESAPRTAAAMTATLMRAATYLRDKAPKEPAPQGLTFVQQKARPVSQSEMARFAEVVATIDSPLRVVEDLRNGRMSRERVDALRAVYPQLYEVLRAEVARQAVELRPNLTIQQQVALSVLFDVPVSAMMKPDVIRSFQATFAQGADPSQTAQAGGQAAPQPRPFDRERGSMASAFDRQEAPT